MLYVNKTSPWWGLYDIVLYTVAPHTVKEIRKYYLIKWRCLEMRALEHCSYIYHFFSLLLIVVSFPIIYLYLQHSTCDVSLHCDCGSTGRRRQFKLDNIILIKPNEFIYFNVAYFDRSLRIYLWVTLKNIRIHSIDRCWLPRTNG